MLVFGKSYNSDINIVFNDSIIPSSLQTDNLGHVVGPAIGHEDINSLCNDFMLRINFLLSNFKHCSYDVKYRLVKSYCMAFYGYMLLDLSSKNINKLYVTWRKCIRKFLDIPSQTHSRYVSFIFDDVPIEAQLHKRSVKFLSNIMTSENHVVQLCGKIMSNGSQSSVSKSFNYLAHLYSLSYSQICNVDYATRKMKSLGNSCNEKDFMNIEHIKSLLCMRNNLYFAEQPKDGFTMENLNIMLEYFCMIN